MDISQSPILAAPTRPYVDACGLTKIFRTPAGEFPAVKGIDLQVNRGEFVAIIGKSGSGKSTLINLLTGIDHPTEGEIYIGGEPLHTFDEEQMAAWRGRNLGIVFQFFQLLPTLTLVENVMLPMDINRLYAAAERRDRAMHLLEMVDMVEQARKLPAAVSGGQQQRVAIARALANDPGLIIADEPTGNLDSRTAESIFSLFMRLVAEGKTIIMVTHDEARAARTTRSVMIADGEVVNEHVAQALSALNYDQLAEVQRHVSTTTYPPGSVIVRQGEPGEHFYILTDGRADVLIEQSDGRELLVDHLEAGQYFGEMALVTGGGRRATVRAASSGPVSVAALDLATFTNLIEQSPELRQELQQINNLRQLQGQVDSLREIRMDDLLTIAADAPTKVYMPGEDVVRQGALGDTFYFILEGEAGVWLRRGTTDTRIDALQAGNFFGELALLGDRRRTASVRAEGDQPLRVLELDAQAFDQLIESSDRFAQQVKGTADDRTSRVQ